MKKIISTEKAPLAIGPYSQAVQTGHLIFVSGQLPLDPKTMEIVLGGIKEQTIQAMNNIKIILEEAESSLNKIVKVTVLMQDLSQFAEMNEVYAQFFDVNPPARVTYQVAKLPRNALIEIEVVAEV